MHRGRETKERGKLFFENEPFFTLLLFIVVISLCLHNNIVIMSLCLHEVASMGRPIKVNQLEYAAGPNWAECLQAPNVPTRQRRGYLLLKMESSLAQQIETAGPVPRLFLRRKRK